MVANKYSCNLRRQDSPEKSLLTFVVDQLETWSKLLVNFDLDLVIPLVKPAITTFILFHHLFDEMRTPLFLVFLSLRSLLCLFDMQLGSGHILSPNEVILNP